MHQLLWYWFWFGQNHVLWVIKKYTSCASTCISTLLWLSNNFLPMASLGLTWLHHFTKRGGLRSINYFKPATFDWSVCNQIIKVSGYVFVCRGVDFASLYNFSFGFCTYYHRLKFCFHLPAYNHDAQFN